MVECRKRTDTAEVIDDVDVKDTLSRAGTGGGQLCIFSNFLFTFILMSHFK